MHLLTEQYIIWCIACQPNYLILCKTLYCNFNFMAGFEEENKENKFLEMLEGLRTYFNDNFPIEMCFGFSSSHNRYCNVLYCTNLQF